jgi:hypothetical protein
VSYLTGLLRLVLEWVAFYAAGRASSSGGARDAIKTVEKVNAAADRIHDRDDALDELRKRKR